VEKYKIKLVPKRSSLYKDYGLRFWIGKTEDKYPCNLSHVFGYFLTKKDATIAYNALNNTSKNLKPDDDDEVHRLKVEIEELQGTIRVLENPEKYSY
jgi:hypothetical protein